MQPLETELTPRRIFAVIRRRAPMVLVCLVVAVAVALAYSLHAQKKYTATASLLFNNAPLSQQVAGLGTSVPSNTQSQQDTNTQLLKLGDVAQKTAATLGHGLTKDAVAASIAITPNSDTTVVNVSSTLSSAALAARVANTYTTVFVNEQENGNRQYYQSALDTVEGQIAKLSPAEARGAQGLALQERAQSLATLAQLRTGSVSLAQAASIPDAPSSPDTKRNVILAALLGIVLGALLAFLIERLDQYVRDPEELEKTYGLPLLGVVPQSSALRRSNRDGRRSPPPPNTVMDAFQSVRARLRYFNVDTELRTLAVVSAQPGDGKTTIAYWLARAAAATGTRTLLIEADLRRPTMAQGIGLEIGPGLADVLIGFRPFDEAVQVIDVTMSSYESGAHTLHVVVSGALPPNPAELLESHAMADLLQRVQSLYDFIVIDTPPLGAVSDALPLVGQVDGVTIVAGMARNRRDSAIRLKATLDSVNAPMLGVIANRVKARDGAQYGYGYGYSSQPDIPRLSEASVAKAVGPEDLGPAARTFGRRVRQNGSNAEPSAAPAEDDQPGHVKHPPRSAGATDGGPRGTAEKSVPAESAAMSAPPPSLRSPNGGLPSPQPVSPRSRPQAESRAPVIASGTAHERIIIYRLGSIGDTVAALPCFHLVEQAFPNAERLALTNVPESSKAAPLESILKEGGFIHGSIPYPLHLRDPRELRRLAKFLRNQNAHTIVYLRATSGVPATWRDIAFFRMCGIDNIVGAPITNELVINRVDSDGTLEPESHRLARTLQDLGSIDLDDRSWWDLRLTPNEHARASMALGGSASRRFLAVNTGGKASQKDWGVSAWTSLLRSLGDQLGGWDLAFVGAREDHQRAAQLGNVWPGKVVDLCGRLSPRESAAALSKASLFIGHDSGALHLADAVGTPAVGLFGHYNEPKKWHPSGPQTHVIHKMSGLQNISPAEVIEEAIGLIGLVERR